jgi:hypothetical protein
MGWMIGRAAVLADPEAAKRKALEKLRGLTELDDPESLVVPILIDAMLLVEAYRGARHQITQLPELTDSVDALLRELTIIEKSIEWSRENVAASAAVSSSSARRERRASSPR